MLGSDHFPKRGSSRRWVPAVAGKFFKNDLGVVTCCLAKPAISSFRFRQEYDLLVFETSTEKREKHSFEKELTQID